MSLRLFGHPLHPPSTHVPLGLLLVVPLGDAAALIRGGPGWWGVSFWVLAVGLAAGLLAAVTGLLDYAGLDTKHPGEPTAFRHMVIMCAALLLDLGSLLVRAGPGVLSGGRAGLAVLLSGMGAAVLAVGGWYGGHLVYHHRIGLDDRR